MDDQHPNEEPQTNRAQGIELRDLYKEYPSGGDKIVVLDHVNMSIPHGSLVVITGDSGAGKTSFLNMLAALDKPSSGELFVEGFEIGNAGEKALSRYRNQGIGLVFQFHYLLKEFSTLENVMLPAFMSGMGRAEATERARALLEKVGLGERLGHFPSQLSGGERQRAAVARSLINDPPLVLADEPTGNLDERNSRMVEELLFGLARDLGKTLVVVTHNTRLADDGSLHLHLSRGQFAVRELAR